jgi:hypothetical protein
MNDAFLVKGAIPHAVWNNLTEETTIMIPPLSANLEWFQGFGIILQRRLPLQSEFP